jgi:DNA-binding transcriptional ArsR family regulator
VLDTLVTSKTRLKLILKFFLNPGSRAYLRGLSEEFGESSNAVRLELNRFEEAGLLETESKGNKKLYQANTKHPLFQDIHNIIRKTIGIDQIVESVVSRLGDVEEAYVTGDFAKGRNGSSIDIALIGTNLNREYLIRLVDKAEALIKRKIRYIILTKEEAPGYLKETGANMLIWKK